MQVCAARVQAVHNGDTDTCEGDISLQVCSVCASIRDTASEALLD